MNSMKNVFLEAMNEPFDLTTMLERIDYHHVRGKLTDTDREELVETAREKANPFGGVDVMAKLQDHETRLIALEKAKQESGETGETGETGDTEEVVPEYQAGKWYYTGDKVTYDGAVYVCIAPAGVVCTWSPAEYPAYWEAQ